MSATTPQPPGAVPADTAPLAQRVRDAVFWRSGSQIVAQTVMWGSTIIVVRLLDPHDYGLFAMSQVVLVLFNFLNGYSFASSLIQDDKLDGTRVSQVFGLLIVLNGGLAAVQFITAPLAAAYFRQPGIEAMLKVQCLLYLATPVIALNGALLARGLEFRNQAIANFAGAIAGAGTALTCAYAGLGVWTLIVAPLALLTVRAVGLSIAAGGVPRPSFRFDGLSGVLGFGGALLAAQFFWIIQSQADIVIAGRSLNPHDLGLYSEALFLTLIFTAKFIPPLNEVAFPAYVQLLRERGSAAGA
ncbi:MAG TPA: oligosaccharide flippase family protein, partial [Chloroflexota bacterium]|nr:oligosaccharide flippase family protein [Chloroflexota bacterium]